MADNSLRQKHELSLQKEQASEAGDKLENDLLGKDLSVNKDYIFQSKRKGLLFPVLVIASALLISGTVYLLSELIINLDINSYYNGNLHNRLIESALMKKVKQDNDRAITDKNREINKIQKKLDNYNEQLKTLRELIFAKSRGEDLSGSNISSEYSEMSIVELEKTLGEIENEKNITENELSKKVNEKRKLVENSEKTAGISHMNIDQELINISEIQEKLERQESVNTQLYIMQTKIFNDIKTGNFQNARHNIENIKTIMYLESNNDIPDIARTRSSYGNSIEIVEKYISAQEELKKRNSGGSFDGFKYTLLFSDILTEIDNNNLDKAALKIKGFKSAIGKETDISIGGSIGQKDQYMRTASVIEDYIDLNNEINKLKGSESGTELQSENIIPETLNSFPDYEESDLLLCGKIAYTDNKSLSIETFFQLPITPGDLFLIKNKKTEIACGEIISLTGSSVKGKIEKQKNPDIYPEINNLVYIIKN